MWVDGREYNGEWIDNNMHGYGVYTWKDGRRYEGQYIKDRKHGQGVYLWADGRKYDGQWQNGRQHGEGTYWVKADQKPRRGIWVEGKRDRWLDATATAK